MRIVLGAAVWLAGMIAFVAAILQIDPSPMLLGLVAGAVLVMLAGIRLLGWGLRVQEERRV